MVEVDLWERLVRAEAAHLAALTCNKLLVATAAVFAGIALLLSGCLGFLLGRHSQTESSVGSPAAAAVPDRSRPLAPADGFCAPAEPELRQDSVLQDPSENVLQPRLGSKDRLKPIGSTHVQDLDSARQASAAAVRPEIAQAVVLPGFAAEDGNTQALNKMPDALKAVYANYISRWQDNASPWKEPTAGRESRIGSRVPSFTSEASEQLTWQSSLNIGQRIQQPALSQHPSGASVVSTQLLYADWEIPTGQIKFSYTAKGDLVRLGRKDDSSPTALYKAVLDGQLSVAVRTLKLTREAFPDDKLTEVALQQLSLNGAQQLVHFYGLSRTEESVMLVYEYVEGGNMRDAIRQNPGALGWYRSGKVIARDVAQGLAYLHNLGMEHRSFKTSRVLVRASDCTAKIADAALQAATRYCQHSRSRRLATSFEWAAPEWLLGQRCGPEADIFGFGITLWELVTHEMPIRGALRDVRVPEECPAAIKALISKCMAREPDMRPTADEVVATIQRAWNARADGRRRGSDIPVSALRLAPRPSLKVTQSQPVTPSCSPPRGPSPPGPGNPRDTRDSVSEMVDIRRGTAVRKGTLQSVQSAGGATSPMPLVPEDGIPRGQPRKPPPSPHSSPESVRRTLSPGARKFGSLEAIPASSVRAALAAQHGGLTVSQPSSRRSSPIQRYMSGTGERELSDADAKRQQQRLARDRKKRAKALQSVHSAPNLEGCNDEAASVRADDAAAPSSKPVEGAAEARSAAAALQGRDRRQDGRSSRSLDCKEQDGLRAALAAGDVASKQAVALLSPRKVRAAAELSAALQTELSLTDVVVAGMRQRDSQGSRPPQDPDAAHGHLPRPRSPFSPPDLAPTGRPVAPAAPDALRSVELRPTARITKSPVSAAQGSVAMQNGSGPEGDASADAEQKRSSLDQAETPRFSGQNPFSAARTQTKWEGAAEPAAEVAAHAMPLSDGGIAATSTAIAETLQMPEQAPAADKDKADTQPRSSQDVSRMDRWRQRCDAALNQWLGADGSPEDAARQPARTGTFSRFRRPSRDGRSPATGPEAGTKPTAASNA